MLPTIGFILLCLWPTAFIDQTQVIAEASASTYMITTKSAANWTDFKLKIKGVSPKRAVLSLNNTQGIQIATTCSYPSSSVSGQVARKAIRTDITKQLKNTKISGKDCFWSLPVNISSSFGPILTRNTTYYLQLNVDGAFVYNQTDFKLNGASSATLHSLLMMAILAGLLYR